MRAWWQSKGDVAPSNTMKTQIDSLTLKTLGMIAAVLCGSGMLLPSASHAKSGAPPPPILTGSGGPPIITGSGNPPPPPPPPPILTGSGAPPIVTGSGNPPPPPPPPPVVTGSGAPPIVTGSGNPPPPWAGGTGDLPTGSSESLTVRIAFTAASGTTTSANGVLQAIGINGADHGSLALHTTGLATGTYTMSAVTETGTAPVTLGTFDVRAPGGAGTPNPAAPPRGGRSNTRFGGPRGIPFPDGFDPFDISSLAISDSNANVLFTADLTTVTDGVFDARAPLVSGTGVTAKGSAAIHVCAKGGVVDGTLRVRASGLPASTTYTYAVDGTDVGTVTTGAAGSLRLVATEKPSGGSLPASVNLFTVTEVTVHDSSGNVILSASF